MTTHKDFKRLVRARMRKTGEAYTTARRMLISPRPASPAAAAPPAPADYEKLSGIKNAAVKAGTGCDWERWVHALDRVDAWTWPHREIAQYVRQKYKTPDWWTQTVTTGYERIKGLRAIGQRRGGGFEVHKSKVFGVPVATLYRAFSGARSRDAWLPGVTLKIRAATRNKSMRITWPDGTSVEAYFVPKGPKKSQLAIAHTRVPDAATAGQLKEFWTARLAVLAELHH